MEFMIIKPKNTVEITDIQSFPSLAKIPWDYIIPEPGLRGYGFLPIAIFIAASIAKRHGISTLSIEAASEEVAEYYVSYGFMRHSMDNYWGKMLFPLKEMEAHQILLIQTQFFSSVKKTPIGI